tara:strand:+ start:55244 stop:56125 length:882 start_codon:yes stop_codon:yes gene_type:complete
MIEKKSPFFAFRFLVTPINNQVSVMHELNKSKEELMQEIIQSLNINTKTEWLKGSKRYLIYGFQKKNDFFILKYARESNEKIYVEGESDIEVKGIKETKFVFLIIDVKNQVILIERNTSVFNSVRSAINILSDYFRERMREYDYVVNIYPLVSKKSFWNYIDEADEVFELSLVLNAPNMPFLGDSDTRSVLQKIKDTTNNEEFEIGLRNKEGTLKVVQETLGTWINYIREVGGKYMIKFKKNGVEQKKTSYDDTAKTFIPRKKTEIYNDEELKNIEDKLNMMHNLENRDNEEN